MFIMNYPDGTILVCSCSGEVFQGAGVQENKRIRCISCGRVDTESNFQKKVVRPPLNDLIKTRDKEAIQRIYGLEMEFF